MRVEKLVARSNEGPAPIIPTQRRFGTNTVDFETYEITGQRGLKKRLTHREMLLLRLLTERAGDVVSREEILQKVRDELPLEHDLALRDAGAGVPDHRDGRHRRGDERRDESWPTTGVPSSTYSRQKAAVERILDEV